MQGWRKCHRRRRPGLSRLSSVTVHETCHTMDTMKLPDYCHTMELDDCFNIFFNHQPIGVNTDKNDNGHTMSYQ